MVINCNSYLTQYFVREYGMQIHIPLNGRKMTEIAIGSKTFLLIWPLAALLLQNCCVFLPFFYAGIGNWHKY